MLSLSEFGMMSDIATYHPTAYLPHAAQLLQSLRISRERLATRSKVAIGTSLLRALLREAIRNMPFDEAFYREANPDIAAAQQAGDIVDLHEHYVEIGYLEGRVALPPVVDEAFYLSTYTDVGDALRRGDIGSAREHYLRSGAAEGRLPSPAFRPMADHWAAILAE
jgi:hypothetical protein